MSDFYYPTQSYELYHYGVPGMKWGKRKALPTSDLRNRYNSAKTQMKSDKKQYIKDSNSAYYRNHPFSLSKKRREASNQRWEKAAGSADKFFGSKKEFKKVKAERSQAIKSTYKDIQKNASKKDKLIYNNATRKKAAKYVVDNNMTLSEANKRAKSDANRNTAAVVAAYGAVAVATLYKATH